MGCPNYSIISEIKNLIALVTGLVTGRNNPRLLENRRSKDSLYEIMTGQAGRDMGDGRARVTRTK